MFPKACPRCHGDIYSKFDEDGVEMACLQCGRTLSPSQATALWVARKVRLAKLSPVAVAA